MAFRTSKGYFTAVIYPEGATFVSIRFDIGHCFHIWCIQAFLCSSEIFPVPNFRLSHVQFSLIFRWLWHDAFLPSFQHSTLFLSCSNFSLDSLSLSSDSDIWLHDMNAYCDVMLNQCRCRCTIMAEIPLQIMHKSKHKTMVFPILKPAGKKNPFSICPLWQTVGSV